MFVRRQERLVRNIEPLTRKFEHNQGWLLWAERTLGKEAYAIEALKIGPKSRLKKALTEAGL
jgi:hypothetical protein